MAFENLFIRTKKSIGGVQLDGVISESHKNSVRLTSNPVELGADITDHSIIEPKIISIRAMVTDSPLGTAAFGEIVDRVSGFFGTATSDNQTRSQSAYNALVSLMEQREPIEIQTKLVLYQDMVITNISTIQDKDSSRIVEMIIDAKEVRIVETETAQLSPETLNAGTTRQQASPPNNRGRQEAQTPVSSTQKSVLKKGLDWLL